MALEIVLSLAGHVGSNPTVSAKKQLCPLGQGCFFFLATTVSLFEDIGFK